MRYLIRACMPAILMLCGAGAWGAVLGQNPYAGYVYPAGGQQGTTFRVKVGGQRLKGVSDAYVSGRGVSVSVVNYQGPDGPLTRLQQDELKRRLQEIRDQRRGPSAEKPRKGTDKPDRKPQAGAKAEKVELPDLPELRNLEQKPAMELFRLAEKFISQRNRPKAPIAEEVTLEVTVNAGAEPGDRELRLRTPIGLTNPLVFQIGRIRETREPGKDEAATSAPTARPPIVLNGQIMPGQVDRFPLQLRGGERLVVAAQARKLIPYLADAVPGWFQATVAMYDSNGHELAYDDDCGYDPDPAFVFKAPRDGQYTLEIRDAIYRGREDFVYRVDVGDESIVGYLFPSGSRGGVSIAGGNGTSHEQDSRNTSGTGTSQEQDSQNTSGILSSVEGRRVDGTSGLVGSAEKEPNDSGKAAMRIALPRIIVGAISAPGDKDVFAFKAKAGDQVAAEVHARKTGSGLDSLLRLIDSSGRVVAVNDDHADPEEGLLTHHADSYVSAKLPKTGDYFLQVSDAQGGSGRDHTYSLRIGPPKPDFALRITPSSLNVAAGRAVVVTAYALRKDGWDGDIEVVLKDAPEGFVLNGARIPKGRDSVRMTMTVPMRGRFREPYVLNLEGRAQIGGKTVVRPAVPADNMMQAFAYQHLVPAEQLMVAVTPGGRKSQGPDMADGQVLRIPAGRTAEVSLPVGPTLQSISAALALSDPPAGVTLLNQYVQPDQIKLVFLADDKHVGYADNLIVEVFAEREAKPGKGTSAQKQRVSLGVLPAIPFEIVKP